MAGRYKSYSDHKDSGVEWLGSIPNHWDVKKLKFLAYIQPSNVDKKTSKNETPVLLCNYTDVYYNETVHADMDFMKASATEDQIEKFTLKSGDIIITKDSEDPNDIAIPTFVPESMPGVVCGYHLSIIRPQSTIYGLYIKRVFECGYARAYFSTRSNGLTRYGLGTHALANVFYPKPPEKEAENIANFLDHETAKIDTLIEKQQQLIQLLKEKRQAVISHAVTKGLNPNVKLRNSGVLSIGLMPEHWTLKSLSLASKKLAVGLAMSVTDCYEEEGVPIIRNQNIKEGYFDGGDMLYLNPVFAEAQASKKVKAGDVVIVRTGSNVGLTCCVPDEYDQCHTFTTLIVTPSDELVKEYFTYCMNSAYGKAEVNRLKFGFGKDNLNVGELRAFHTLLPSVDEQKEIVSYLEQEVAKIDLMVKKAYVAIGLMQERRTALISAAVTGKIDVRDWVAPKFSLINREVAA
ncbi:restriction endonuclease subunit S [Pseudomonas extremaustralis]|uniref:restriction endonuclease subunit S n=1 Tax=Pseudomonas extremaustralis TaxID=359110 RepID=UPI002410A22A|nr:restriction endonuclease subunit S [Pseudomonas extremaustralis]MDG2969395.1 restriction endonuclease subunit S [Pseudomonas extremaustralis]